MSEQHPDAKKLLENPGWYVLASPAKGSRWEHGADCDCGNPANSGNSRTANYRTYGLPEKYDHDNLQIVLRDCRPESAHMIFWDLVEMIEDGAKFTPGMIVHDVLGNGYRGKIVAVSDAPRLLRLILPPKSGTLTRQLMKDAYADQWEGIL